MLCTFSADQVVPEKELKHEAPLSSASGNKEQDKSTDLLVDEYSDSASAVVNILDVIDREYMEVTSADIFQHFFAKDDEIFD